MTPSKRLNDLARTAAADFDSTLLHNRVHEQVQGQHGDDDLRRVLELANECYNLSDVRGGVDDGVGRAAFNAAESLNDQIDTLVEEAVAEACKTIVRDAPNWTDAWSVDECNAATAEAMNWLGDHPEYADPAEVRADA